jgi:hypothetical protein
MPLPDRHVKKKVSSYSIFLAQDQRMLNKSMGCIFRETRETEWGRYATTRKRQSFSWQGKAMSIRVLIGDRLRSSK